MQVDNSIPSEVINKPWIYANKSTGIEVKKEDFRQLRRLDVRPGITGLWQIRGRSDISFARLIKWDMWYIKNWSLWLDLNILFNTIPVVVKGKGAY